MEGIDTFEIVLDEDNCSDGIWFTNHDLNKFLIDRCVTTVEIKWRTLHELFVKTGLIRRYNKVKSIRCIE